MIKKNFLLAKKISFGILILLFFSENSFGFFNDRKDFYENFYSEIYENTDYKKKSLKRISEETGLKESFLNLFYQDKGNGIWEECKKNSGSFCEIVKKTSSNNITYYENLLKEKISNELKLIKFEENLISFGENEEIFADGDYENSFFDVVTQWNIIDVILFGKDGMTPFFKYEKKDENGENNQNQKNFGDQEIIVNENEKKYESEGIKFFDDFSEKKDENLTNSSENGFSNSKITQIKNYEEINEICLDPFAISEDFFEQEFFQQEGKNISILENLLEKNNNIGSENFDIEKTETDSEKFLNDFETTPNGFLKPKKNGGEKCKKPLYGGYICLDDIGKGNCYEIGKDGENGSFCREILFIKDSQELFGNGSSDNSVNGYISKGLRIIEDEIYGEAIYPRENSLNNGNLPNLIGFKRDFSFLDISWMAMPWEKENYKKNEKKRIYFEDFFEPGFKDKIGKAEGEIRNLEFIESDKEIEDRYVDYNNLKIESLDKTAIIKDGIQGDVNMRITEFRTLFQNGILDNINGLPFEKLQKIKTCKQAKTE